jgi:hypothetical protein
MTIEELRAELEALVGPSLRDPERYHGEADDALIAYINDPEVTRLFNAIDKYYA